jgi:hypothetical protein
MIALDVTASLAYESGMHPPLCFYRRNSCRYSVVLDPHNWDTKGDELCLRMGDS